MKGINKGFIIRKIKKLNNKTSNIILSYYLSYKFSMFNTIRFLYEILWCDKYTEENLAFVSGTVFLVIFYLNNFFERVHEYKPSLILEKNIVDFCEKDKLKEFFDE